MGARGGKATAGNGGSRKNHHDDSAEAQTNSHRCSRSIEYSQGLTPQGRAEPKEKPAGMNRPRAPQQSPTNGFRLPVNNTVKPFRRKMPTCLGASQIGEPQLQNIKSTNFAIR